MNVHSGAGEQSGASEQSGAAAAATEVKTINLALQGGGAHGAFTWGVLDRLLEETSIDFEGVTATSAGATNGAVLAYGLTVGGRERARELLEDFWRRVSRAALYSPLRASPFDRLTRNYGLDNSSSFVLAGLLSRLVSPYRLNPLNVNPLKQILQQVVDFERLRQDSVVKLFFAATNVRTGKIKIFTEDDTSVDAVLASACLPFMYQAVEIDGEHYWDGGYMGNPALYPLIYRCDCQDVLIVHINPLNRNDVPMSAADIADRINEISFNSSLMREMRAVAFMTRLIDEGRLTEDGELKRTRIHAIEADDVMQGLGSNSKLNADWGFLQHLRDIGRQRANEWLEGDFARVGIDSSVDIHGTFL